jgi:hypothetical protein
MSAAAVHNRMPHPRTSAWVRRTVPSLTLLSTATGWALYDDSQQLVFEAPGPRGRLECLKRALSLGVVRLRAGEEPTA